LYSLVAASSAASAAPWSVKLPDCCAALSLASAAWMSATALSMAGLLPPVLGGGWAVLDVGGVVVVPGSPSLGVVAAAPVPLPKTWSSASLRVDAKPILAPEETSTRASCG